MSKVSINIYNPFVEFLFLIHLYNEIKYKNVNNDE